MSCRTLTRPCFFWAGLRGAVGVALAAGLTGESGYALRATVLVVVVLTVIIFGGTTARMLEILGIRTGVVEEIDSDDEFDIEIAAGGTYYKRTGTGVGNLPIRNDHAVALSPVDIRSNGQTGQGMGGYSSGNARQSPPVRPNSGMAARKNSVKSMKPTDGADQNLLSRGGEDVSDEDDIDSDSSDLPPAAARRKPPSTPSRDSAAAPAVGSYPLSGTTDLAEAGGDVPGQVSTSGAISQFFSGASEDHAAWFRQLDEGYIKPKLLLDSGKGGGSAHGSGTPP